MDIPRGSVTVRYLSAVHHCKKERERTLHSSKQLTRAGRIDMI